MAHPDVKSTYQIYVVALQHPYIVKDKLGYYFQSVLLPIYIALSELQQFRITAVTQHCWAE